MEAKTNTFLETEKSVGTAVTLCIIVSLVLTAVYFIFRHPILVMFGGEVNQETYACAKEYFTFITMGIPFYMFGQAMNPIIRSDGSPKFAMAATVSGSSDERETVIAPVFKLIDAFPPFFIFSESVIRTPKSFPSASSIFPVL